MTDSRLKLNGNVAIALQCSTARWWMFHWSDHVSPPVSINFSKSFHQFHFKRLGLLEIYSRQCFTAFQFNFNWISIFKSDHCLDKRGTGGNIGHVTQWFGWFLKIHQPWFEIFTNYATSFLRIPQGILAICGIWFGKILSDFSMDSLAMFENPSSPWKRCSKTELVQPESNKNLFMKAASDKKKIVKWENTPVTHVTTEMP